MIEQFIWSEKFRPQTIEETILPERLKATFRNFVDQGNLPNLLLKGSSGVGKTTIILAAVAELDSTVMVRNASLDGIDALRTDLLHFASTVSLNGKRKYVILDEGDYISRLAQPALRGFTQEYAANCGFAITCNYPSNILKELRSRFTEIDFTIPQDERREMMRQMYVRLVTILETEKIPFDKNAVAELMKRYAPDWRKCIDELQRYSTERGKIDAGILTVLGEAEIASLYKLLKAKNFPDIRKWVAEHSDMDPNLVFRALFDTMHDKLTMESAATAVTIIAEYQYKSIHVADQEINTLACLTDIMVNAVFKV